MKVKLKHYTPLQIADDAIGKCWDKPSNGECNTKRMHRVANQFKHASTIEHLSYNFDIDGISRALLQEQARHRIASYSVKSSRYTLAELLKEHGTVSSYLVKTGNDLIDNLNIEHMEKLKKIMIENKIENDIAKYAIVEAYKTSLIWTINARSLQNFLKLRTDKSALWEIRELAYAVYEQLPKDHKFLFEEFLYIGKDNIEETYEVKKEIYKVTMLDRERHYDATGQIVSDDVIKKWLSR